MRNQSSSAIVAVTTEDGRHRHVLDRAAARARETGETVILFDLDADMGPLESPLPTGWSGDGQEEQFGDRLDPGDLEAAGRRALADQVRALRAAGVEAFGWLPPTADADALAEYARGEDAELILVSADDAALIDRLRSTVGEVVVSGEAKPGREPRPAAGDRIRVEAVPPH